jgi:Zn-dependent protease with chaperone function
MAKNRTKSEIAAGKLISQIQKEWSVALGEPGADVTETVMNLAHDLLKARTGQAMLDILQGRTVSQYLGETWVANHPSVVSAIEQLEAALK